MGNNRFSRLIVALSPLVLALAVLFLVPTKKQQQLERIGQTIMKRVWAWDCGCPSGKTCTCLPDPDCEAKRMQLCEVTGESGSSAGGDADGGGGGTGGSSSGGSSGGGGGGCTCDGWAACGAVHDNVQTCRKYICENGSWRDIGSATHPQCGGTQDSGRCGDGSCANGESQSSCPQDCGQPGGTITGTGGSGGSGGNEGTEQCTLRLTHCGASNQGSCPECGNSCDPGYKIDSGRCIPQNASNACNSDAECSGGQVCQAGACITPQSGGGGANSTGTSGYDYENYDYITFRCERCGADGRCQNGIGVNPTFSFGANPDPCAQVDRRRKGDTGNWEAVSLCDASCSGGSQTTSSLGGESPSPTSTSQPSPTPVGMCTAIKVYDTNNTEITAAIADGSRKLTLGETVILATPKGQATKARFRIQGVADWTENDPAKTTDAEYRLAFEIPATITQTQGTFEVEVFINNEWK